MTKSIEFEAALEALILEAFIAGFSPEGEWEVSLRSPNVPTWTVEVRKHAPEAPDYEPSVLDG